MRLGRLACALALFLPALAACRGGENHDAKLERQLGAYIEVRSPYLEVLDEDLSPVRRMRCDGDARSYACDITFREEGTQRWYGGQRPDGTFAFHRCLYERILTSGFLNRAGGRNEACYEKIPK